LDALLGPSFYNNCKVNTSESIRRVTTTHIVNNNVCNESNTKENFNYEAFEICRQKNQETFNCIFKKDSSKHKVDNHKHQQQQQHCHKSHQFEQNLISDCDSSEEDLNDYSHKLEDEKELAEKPLEEEDVKPYDNSIEISKTQNIDDSLTTDNIISLINDHHKHNQHCDDNNIIEKVTENLVFDNQPYEDENEANNYVLENQKGEY
jgi:hypothetical protein